MTIQEKINKFKEKTVTFALNYIQDNSEFANVRELKDLTSIVDIIEKSYKQQDDPKSNFTSMFTNIVAKFETDIKQTELPSINSSEFNFKG